MFAVGCVCTVQLQATTRNNAKSTHNTVHTCIDRPTDRNTDWVRADLDADCRHRRDRLRTARSQPRARAPRVDRKDEAAALGQVERHGVAIGLDALWLEELGGEEEQARAEEQQRWQDMGPKELQNAKTSGLPL